MLFVMLKNYHTLRVTWRPVNSEEKWPHEKFPKENRDKVERDNKRISWRVSTLCSLKKQDLKEFGNRQTRKINVGECLKVKRPKVGFSVVGK